MGKKIKEKNFKILLVTIAVITILLIAQTSIYAITGTSDAGNTVTVEIEVQGNPELKAGEYIDVDVVVTGDGIMNFEGYLEFDPAYYEYAEIIGNDSLEESWTITYCDDPALPAYKKITYFSNSGDDEIINGTLFTVRLQILQDIAGDPEITIEDIIITDAEFEEIEFGNVGVNYNINFYANTTDNVTNLPAKITKEQGVDCILPQGPSRAGYTFNNWNTQADGNGTEYEAGSNYSIDTAVDFYAQWTANEDTAYTVEHYKQNADGTYPTTATETENLTGTTDTQAQAVVKTYTGYAQDTTNTNNVLSGNIAGNGSLVLKVYYKMQCTITYKPGTKGTFGEQSIVADLNAATPAYEGTLAGVAGYTFAGWSPEVTETVTGNAEYVAQWTANGNTAYTVEHYKQNADGTYPQDATETENLTGTTGAVVQAVAKTYTGYSQDTTNTNNVLSGTVAGDGSLVLKVYYKLQYTVTYKPGIYGTFGEQVYNVEVGDPTPAFVGEITGVEGYDFIGWNNEISETVTGNTEYIAQWQIKTFNITYNPNGGAGAPATQIKTYGEIATISSVVPEKEGYEFLKWNTMPDGTGTNYLPGSEYETEEEVTLYAQWQIGYKYYAQNENDRIGFDSFDEAKAYMEEHITELWIVTDKNGNVVDQIIDFGDIEPGTGTKEIKYFVKESENDANTEENTFGNFADAKESADENNLKVYDENGNLIYKKMIIVDLYVTSDVYVDETIYFNEIAPETTYAEFKENVETNGDLKVYNFNNVEADDDELIGTGMIMRVTKGEQMITMMLVVEGDMDGNGKVTVTDLSMLNKQLVGTKLLKRGKLRAADISDEWEVTITDLSELNQILVDKED